MSVREFIENGYIKVENAISKDIRDIVTQYTLFDEMNSFNKESNYFSNAQVPNAHSKYADPVMESMLLHLKETVQIKTDLNLYPTYSYYRVYRNGDILQPHKDRESCEISVTACFNYSYNDSQYSWPIIMNGNRIEMFPGDIVIYRGIDLEHSRDRFNPPGDDWHVQAFLHYVDSNGKYADWKFDKRSTVGEKQNNKKYISYF